MPHIGGRPPTTPTLTQPRSKEGDMERLHMGLTAQDGARGSWLTRGSGNSPTGTWQCARSARVECDELRCYAWWSEACAVTVTVRAAGPLLMCSRRSVPACTHTLTPPSPPVMHIPYMCTPCSSFILTAALCPCCPHHHNACMPPTLALSAHELVPACLFLCS